MRRTTTVAAGAAVLCLAAVLAGTASRAAPQDTGAPPAESTKRNGVDHLARNRFLFFAVLEGLMEDGMGDDAVKAVLEKDAKDRYRNFVSACDVCSPVLEAFRAFDGREGEHGFYYSRKGDPYAGTDGTRIPAEIASMLADPDVAARRKGLALFVARCVARRLALLRLDDKERGRWQRDIAIGRKEGMSFLRRWNESPTERTDMETCPNCDGAADGAVCK